MGLPVRQHFSTSEHSSESKASTRLPGTRTGQAEHSVASILRVSVTCRVSIYEIRPVKFCIVKCGMTKHRNPRGVRLLVRSNLFQCDYAAMVYFKLLFWRCSLKPCVLRWWLGLGLRRLIKMLPVASRDSLGPLCFLFGSSTVLRHTVSKWMDHSWVRAIGVEFNDLPWHAVVQSHTSGNMAYNISKLIDFQVLN